MAAVIRRSCCLRCSAEVNYYCRRDLLLSEVAEDLQRLSFFFVAAAGGLFFVVAAGDLFPSRVLFCFRYNCVFENGRWKRKVMEEWRAR